MTEIKCRYETPYCTVYDQYFPGPIYLNHDYGYIGDNGRLHHDEFWFCDSNKHCPISHYTRPNDAPKLYINPTCVYCSHKYGEFAKYVKNYSYDSEGLTIGRDFYALCEIEYLEIDGRILIGGDEV